MKKGFIATAVTALAIGACTLPVHAATSTDVQIGVSKTAVPTTVVNVTVPMKVAVAVDASAATGNPSVLLGKVINTVAGTATDDASAGALLFTNYGAEAKITAAKVQNGPASNWTLKTTPTAAHEMSFKVNNSASAYDIAKGMSGDILDTDVVLAAGTVTNGKDTVAPLDVKVGGAVTDYTAEDSAQAFRVAWTIALK